MGDDLKELSAKCSELSSICSDMKAQLRMLNPADLIEFKGKIVNALAHFDSDLASLEKRMTKNETEIASNKESIAILKAKIGIVGFISGLFAGGIINAILYLIFRV